MEDVLVVENIDRLAGFVYELSEWRRSEANQEALTEAEVRRQKEIEAFEAMERENKRLAAEKRETEMAYEQAQEKLRMKIEEAEGRVRPKLGPAKPDWLKNKQAEGPPTKATEGEQTNSKEPKPTETDSKQTQAAGTDDASVKKKAWISLDDDSGEDEESSESEQELSEEDS